VLTPAQRVCAASLPEHPGIADWYPFAIFFLSMFLMPSLRFALDSPHLSLRMRASLVLRLHRAGVVSREPPAGWPAGAHPAPPASTLQHRPRAVLQRQDGHTEEAVRRRSTELDQPIIVCSNASDAQFRGSDRHGGHRPEHNLCSALNEIICLYPNQEDSWLSSHEPATGPRVPMGSLLVVQRIEP
jgi:hypothetical protein